MRITDGSEHELAMCHTRNSLDFPRQALQRRPNSAEELLFLHFAFNKLIRIKIGVFD